ncbi:PAS domain S-box protein [Balneola vulgaris]|uniref:PAS domain S-box protein n=1 Tax=Balneola vulgaris TaxID=287535 RepID=UPI00037F99F5|nr:PAS domain S-box protein [Balneola vulgaris]
MSSTSSQRTPLKLISAAETEKRLKLLYQISSQTSTELRTQLEMALKLTTELIGMDIGIISEVKDENYTVQYFYPPDSGLHVGQEFILGSTYCSITLKSDDVVAINHMSESEHNRHPCYEAFSLESYIGIPILIDGELYGTINFSSPKPKEGGFIPSDYILVRLLGEWVGATVKRDRIQTELRQKNELYELISSNSADMICIHDVEGVYEFVSPSSKSILGYTPEELLGKNHYHLIHEEDIEFLRENTHKDLRDAKTVSSVEYRIRNKKGDYIWFESSVTPVKGKDGEVQQLQSVSRDITDRKKVDLLFKSAQEMANVGGWEFEVDTNRLYWTDELYRIYELPIGSEINLEEVIEFFPGSSKDKIISVINRAVERGDSYDITLPFITANGTRKWVRAIGTAHTQDGKTKSMSGTFQDVTIQIDSEKKIVSQNERLKAITATRDKLYSIIAHDLKGAFQGILGMAELLKMELKDIIPVESDTEFKLSLLHMSAQNAYELLENLLDWVRMQDSDIEVNKESIDLEEVLVKSISLMQSAASRKGIEIKQEIYPILMDGDSKMLATVFRNLISNAIKYTDKGGEIKISAKQLTDKVEIVVQDEGVGMNEEIIQSLFDKNNRPQRKGTMSEKGTGLGLILCSELIELHDGSISVESKEGEGSTFTVLLPIH